MANTTNWYDELDEINDNDLQEANNNFSSDHAKTKLIKKYNDLKGTDIKKGNCVLHHLDGDHNNDEDLRNDVLIVANDRKSAELAHKLIHILSYCRIQDYLMSQLESLGVEFFYWPDKDDHPANGPTGKVKEPIHLRLADLFDHLVSHDKKLQDFNVPEDPAYLANPVDKVK